MRDVSEFMGETLRVSKIHVKKHVLYSKMGLKMKSVGAKTENAEMIYTITTPFKLNEFLWMI